MNERIRELEARDEEINKRIYLDNISLQELFELGEEKLKIHDEMLAYYRDNTHELGNEE